MDPGYDDESVAAALTEGNQFFQQKDFSPALSLDFWGFFRQKGESPVEIHIEIPSLNL